MDVWLHQTLIFGIGKFQPIYTYRTVRGCFLLSTYFGIPDILVLEKYIGCPLRPKKVPNIIYLKVRGNTGNLKFQSNPINLYSNLISDKVAMIRHRQVHLVSITLAKKSLPASPVTSYIDKTRGAYLHHIWQLSSSTKTSR